MLFDIEKTKAIENCQKMIEEDKTIKEKESHLLIIKNRIA